MTIDANALRELLERAVELDVKAEALLDAPAEAVVAEDASIDEEDDGGATMMEPPPGAYFAPAADDQIAARLAALEETVAAWAVTVPAGVDPVVDAEAAGEDMFVTPEDEKGFDFAAEEDDGPPAETKVWEPCDCGAVADDVEEYKDGTARCGGCGSLLAAKEVGDAELMEWAQTFLDGKADDPVELGEIEALMARRADLG